MRLYQSKLWTGAEIRPQTGEGEWGRTQLIPPVPSTCLSCNRDTYIAGVLTLQKCTRWNETVQSFDQCDIKRGKEKKKSKSCEESAPFGPSTGQSVFQKQPDQTESEAKPNTSGLQSGTEKQSCRPAEITLHTVSTSTRHTLQCTLQQRLPTFFGFRPSRNEAKSVWNLSSRVA